MKQVQPKAALAVVYINAATSVAHIQRVESAVKVLVNLGTELLLCIRVESKEVGGVGQSVGSGFVARQEECDGVTDNLEVTELSLLALLFHTGIQH